MWYPVAGTTVPYLRNCGTRLLEQWCNSGRNLQQHREIRSYPKVVGVDIGGFTTDYLMFRSGIEDMEICDSMETGIISLYNRITARMHADYDVLLEEADIDSIIQGKKGFYEEKVVRAVLQEANQCAL